MEFNSGFKGLNIHVTVHRDKFLIIKPTICTNFLKFIFGLNSTCFGQFLCPSSGAFHCTHSNGICHTDLLTACKEDQDGRSFLSKSATSAAFTTVQVDFGRPPLSLSTSFLPSRNQEYHLKTFHCFRASSHKPFAPILLFLSQRDRLWNKILWELSVHFRHPWHIKKTDITKQIITRTLSKKNKRN